MLIKEIIEKLIKSKRPIDFFGDVSAEEVSSKYRKYAKILHPDSGNFKDKKEESMAIEAFNLLRLLYKKALKEIDEDIYRILDPIKLFDKKKPFLEIDSYKFYEHYYEGDVSNVFKGLNGDEIVYLKIAKDPADNDLVKNEYEILKTLDHVSLPKVIKQLKVNDCHALIMQDVPGLSVDELLEEYKSGVPATHVMWMLERLFSVIGYLHSKKIVHGNILPEHVIINPETHNVSLLGFSMCVDKANEISAKYKIKNEIYSAPEVDTNTRVLPNSDIYSIGKIAIKLLGGNVETNGMPLSIDPEIREFIRKLVIIDPKMRENDAWKLWDETIELRNEIFGKERFKKLERKI